MACLAPQVSWLIFKAHDPRSTGDQNWCGMLRSSRLTDGPFGSQRKACYFRDRTLEVFRLDYSDKVAAAQLAVFRAVAAE
jgi:hypothetical protein